jgi:hypothetical protein
MLNRQTFSASGVLTWFPVRLAMAQAADVPQYAVGDTWTSFGLTAFQVAQGRFLWYGGKGKELKHGTITTCRTAD